MAKRPHVVIVGAGFGGLAATRALRHVDVDVTIVDRNNYHLFQPLLYQVASGLLDPSAIASPVRTIVRRSPQRRRASRRGYERRPEHAAGDHVGRATRLRLPDHGDRKCDRLFREPGRAHAQHRFEGYERGARAPITPAELLRACEPHRRCDRPPAAAHVRSRRGRSDRCRVFGRRCRVDQARAPQRLPARRFFRSVGRAH